MPSSSSWPPGSHWRTSAPASTPGSACAVRGSRTTARYRRGPSARMQLPEMPLPEMPLPEMPLPEMSLPGPEAEAAAFEEWRPLLFGIAYRMLGSAADAEDIVQDASIRWLRRKDDAVESVRAYLVTIVTRLCL